MSSNLRQDILSAYRMDEQACVEALLAKVTLSDSALGRISDLAKQLVTDIKKKHQTKNGWSALMVEYDLSSEEGVALMCLAEALLRIPDKRTIEKLIADKVSHADWSEHLGKNKSLFVNSTTWSLLLTGKILNLTGVIPNLIKRCGEPIVRQAVTQAVKNMCQQFVMGQTINDALQRAKPMEAIGYRYSYDMLGEEARTALDAKTYFYNYMRAIEVIGAASSQTDIYDRPGISIKLSALHPRFEWRKRERVMEELIPSLTELAVAAKKNNIGFTLDAEEAERLDLTLDVFTALLNEPKLNDWLGLGIAVQAYQKRATFVLDYLIDLAKTKQRRISVRLVKGAYWDAEIKIAQEKGLSGYPVFTRKAATDVSYIACAKQMFAATDAIYPQFATHNAYTVATILELAKSNRDFEFQSLHGMGEDLYANIVGIDKYAVPCRIYAPVGDYQYLFGYLVRRLLENGANNSFVNRVVDENISVEALTRDPAIELKNLKSFAHPRIPLPIDIYGEERLNSKGIDYTNPQDYASVLQTVTAMAKGYSGKGITHINDDQLEKTIITAQRAAFLWGQTSVEERCNYVHKMAEILDQKRNDLIALLVLEGHKTILDATAEVREAIDYCWYYALRASKDFEVQTFVGPTGENNQMRLEPRGIIACISPWNFPLGIFLGQTLAAILAGNSVLAKPAAQTPRIAIKAVELLHTAGIPKDVVQLVIGEGSVVGDTLINDLRVKGVMFTGSTATGWHINRALASRQGPITPLIAETGGQNVMIVDSSALPEQVVVDVINSAFGSAGQRCSCLRVLYLQEEIADRVIEMLCGAMAELKVGDPKLLDTDIGPVIDDGAYEKLATHHEHLQQTAKLLFQLTVPLELQEGYYFSPCAFEIKNIKELPGEVFGPILHVIRYSAKNLANILHDINDIGYGLTMGIHSRIDDTVEFIINRAKVGNIYVNRNMIGAVVGVQPFGGEGLSGTGPKAGGPNYIPRLTVERVVSTNTAAVGGNATLLALSDDEPT